MEGWRETRKKLLVAITLLLIRTSVLLTYRLRLNSTANIVIHYIRLYIFAFVNILFVLQAGMTDTSAVTILFTPMFESAPRTSPQVKAKNCSQEKYKQKNENHQKH